MTKLKGFISYAHKDEPYFDLIKEGFRTHGKNSKLIESDLWHDGKIPAGALWHETILEQVQGCDFAIFLVSANFLSSEYIEEHEFRNFLKRQEEEGFLFFPILVSPCNFKQWEELAARQFFKPSGEAYGCPEARENFTFSHLVSYNFRTGDPFPNPYREQYLMEALVKIEATLQEYQVKKEQKRKFPTSPYFRIIPIQEIQPVDFLGPRSLPNHGFRDFYLERPYLDDHLARNFQQKQPTLVTGKPLAGKTRSILNLCEKKLGNRDILVLIPEKEDFPVRDLKFPETDAEIILFFDDFQEYLNCANLDLLLEKARLQPNIWIAGTCRKDQLYLIENQLTDLNYLFDRLEIQLLNENEELQVEKEVADKINIQSDGTIGGYFVPVDEMRKRYNTLPEGGLEREIFHASKALWIWGKMDSEGRIKIDSIKEYCELRLLHYYQFERKISPFEWDQAFHKLVLKDLILVIENWGTIEEVYLDLFVPEERIALEHEYLSYFPSVKNYNIYLNRSRNWEEALGVLELIRAANISPDVVTFNSLMNKAANWQDALSVLELIKAANVSPDVVTFNSLINKAPNWQDALSILPLIKKANISPNVVTFNSLMNKAANWQNALNILPLMKKANISPNVVTFNSLIHKAANWQVGLSVFQLMKSANITPDVVTFSSLINKAANWQDALSILRLMETANVSPNVVTFNSLMHKAADWQNALNILDLMKTANVSPDVITFSSLINKAVNWQNALSALDLMKTANVSPDVVTFSSLMNKTADWQSALIVFELMKTANVTPDVFTFSSLMHKAADWQDALSVLDLMKIANVSPDLISFETLQDKAQNEEQFRIVANLMEEAGIDLASAFEKDQFLQLIVDNPFPAIRENALKIINARDFQTATEYFSTIPENGVEMDILIFNALLFKTEYFEQAKEILFTMKEQGISPDEATFNLMSDKASTYEETQWLWEEFKDFDF